MNVNLLTKRPQRMTLVSSDSIINIGQKTDGYKSCRDWLFSNWRMRLNACPLR